MRAALRNSLWLAAGALRASGLSDTRRMAAQAAPAQRPCPLSGRRAAGGAR